MFKRIFSVLLTVVMVLSVASCAGKDSTYILSSEVIEPEKKVVIMVSPQTQYKEDFFAAQELSMKYPKTVIVQYCSDSRVLKAGNPDIMDYSVKYAKDKTVGAIIYDRATQFTEAAINAVKEINPDLITVVIEPEGSTQDLSTKTTLMFSADWKKCASDMVATAKQMGAEYFVMFSYDRHMKNDIYILLKNNIQSACEEASIDFIYENSFDPNNAGGITKAEQCIQEAVSRLELNEKTVGKNVVLFSTDSSVQKTLVNLALNIGYMYICPSFPTAYDGIGEVITDVDADDCKDINMYIEGLKTAVKEKKTDGKLAVYSNTLATYLLTAALYSTFDILNGLTNAENINDTVSARLRDACESSELEVDTVEMFGNLYRIYLPGFTILTQ